MRSDRPWEGAPIAPTLSRLGCRPSRSKDKWSCPLCGSGDNLHDYGDRVHCFGGCGSFDAPALVRAALGLSFPGALEWLGYTETNFVPRTTPAAALSDEVAEDWDAGASVDDLAIGLGVGAGPATETVLDWAYNRGIDAETIESLETIAPALGTGTIEGWRDIYFRLGRDRMLASGLAGLSKKDRFYALPWWDQPWAVFFYDGGRFARFRRLHDDEGPKMLSPKGMGSPMDPYLWGQAVYTEFSNGWGAQPLWVVEGEIDALSLWQVGKVAIASPGASVWPWGRMLAREAMRRPVYVVGDGDKAGREFVNLVHASAPGAITRAALWPEGRDANDLLLSGTLEAETDMICS